MELEMTFPLWSIFMMLKLIFKITILHINNRFQKDKAWLKTCLSLRQPAQFGDQKLYKLACGLWNKLVISVSILASNCAFHLLHITVHITKYRSQRKGGFPHHGQPAQSYQGLSCELSSPFFLETVHTVQGIRLHRGKFVLQSSQVSEQNMNSQGCYFHTNGITKPWWTWKTTYCSVPVLYHKRTSTFKPA